MIIAAMYSGPSANETGEGGGDVPTYVNRYTWNAGSANVYSDGFTESFFYKKFSTNTYYYSNGSTGGNCLKPLPNPSETEYWIRLCFKGNKDAGYSSNDYWQAALRYYDATNKYRTIGGLIINGLNIYWSVRNPTVAGSPEVNRQTIGSMANIAVDTVKGAVYFDIRIFLDPVAGFVQIYDYTGTKVGEFLGKTTTALLPTHVDLSIRQMDTYSMPPLFAICANEPTMGMYMVPMRAKAEGADQDHSAGTYSNFAIRKMTLNSNVVTLSAPAATTAKYSVIPKNMTDVSLPANYVVRALQIVTSIDGVSAGLDPLIPIQTLRIRSSGEQYDYAYVKGITPNTDNLINRQYQSQSTILNTNPKTGLAWTVEDMADIEIGVKVTG